MILAGWVLTVFCKQGMAKNHHNVYVVELDDAVFRDKAFVEASPDYDPFLTPMYVGMTGLNPKERFKNHKRG